MDTRDKRSSAILISMPFRGLYPAPDGSLDQGDRQHTALMYRAIEAGGGVAEPDSGGEYFVIIRRRRRSCR